MKRFLRKVISTAMVATVLIAGLSAPSKMTVDAAAGFAESGGWNETAYAEWAAISGSTDYSVYYKQTGTSDSAYVQVDSELVRLNTDTGKYRVDIPGLLGNTDYDIKVVPSSGSTITTTVTTLAHDRSGYAHFNYTEGVGAYKDDGTPKDNAVIIYVTEDNKNTVTIPGYENYANSQGIGWILNNNTALMEAITANRPLIVRIMGEVTAPAGLTGYNSTENGGTVGDNGYMAIIKNAQNITIEGIGYNAKINGWGLSLYHSAAMTNGGKNYEVRNLTFENYPEDALGMQGEMSGGKLTTPIERCWIHNNNFLAGYCANPTESDKGQGDGSCDFKRGQYYTLSYNYFQDCKKTNLIGASDTNLQYNITFHHNWWKNCASRGPLVRQSNIHLYNNFYDGNTSKTIDARANAYVFSEANYFDSCKNPYTTTSGAVIKAYQDVLYNTQEASGMSVVHAETRDQAVPSACLYAGFDTNPDIFYYDSVNKVSDVTRLTDAVTAKAEVKAYSGVMKQTPQAPIRESVFSTTPSSSVSVPYSVDFTDTASGIKFSSGVNTLDNVIYTLTKSFNSASVSSITVKGEGALFKLNTSAKVTIKDGAGTYTIVLISSDGVVLAAPASGQSATVVVPAGVYAVQSSNNLKEGKIASLKIQSESGDDGDEEIVDPTPDPDPIDPVDPEDPVDPIDPIEPSEGCVAMGTYNLNSSFVTNKVSEVSNFKFNLRSVESASVKLRSDNTITFSVDSGCILETDPAGKGITLTSSNGSITYNGSTSQSVTTSAGTQTFTLTAGTYVLSGSESGSNTTLTKLVLR